MFWIIVGVVFVFSFGMVCGYGCHSSDVRYQTFYMSGQVVETEVDTEVYQLTEEDVADQYQDEYWWNDGVRPQV